MLRAIAVLSFLLLPTACLADVEILLFDDLGSQRANFSWNAVSGDQVALSAAVGRKSCLDEDCASFLSTGPLAGLRRSGHDVYYDRAAGGSPIPCGRTQGLLSWSRFLPGCRIRVEPACVREASGCGERCPTASTRYRAYLVIEDGSADAIPAPSDR